MKQPAIAALVLLVSVSVLVAAMTMSSRRDAAAKPTAATDSKEQDAVRPRVGKTPERNSVSSTEPPVSNDPRLKKMVWIPGGQFTMGALDTVPDEFPPHDVELDSFWIDATEVINRQYSEFVSATSYVTTSERPPELRCV